MISPVSSSTSAAPSSATFSRANSDPKRRATSDASALDRTQTRQPDSATVGQREIKPVPSTTVSLSAKAQAALAADKSAPALDVDKSDLAAQHDKEISDADPSPLKSLAYGSLGLQSPQEAAQQKDGWYTAGKWIAAALTVGGIVSLIA